MEDAPEKMRKKEKHVTTEESMKQKGRQQEMQRWTKSLLAIQNTIK